MKIMTIVGARPQFIKAAAVSRVLREKHTEILVHTGQHYDNNMSEIFFDELNIPHPDYNLSVGSGSHGEQTAEMLRKIEALIIENKPDILLVYGDTNSTLAGALAASKLHVRVAHIEAGLRSYNMNMPEEQNRVLCDHISSYLFCPTDTAIENLTKENIKKNVYNVGDVMCDAVLFYSKQLESKDPSEYFDSFKYFFHTKRSIKDFYLATVHRAENTDGVENLSGILAAFEALDCPVVFPVHPRTIKLIGELNEINHYKNICFIEPVSYKEMLWLTSHAKKIVTDSGGLQKEAYILKTPCVTVRDQTEWVETLVGGFNILAKPNKDDIFDKLNNTVVDWAQHKEYYGNGNAGKVITELLEKNENDKGIF